MRRSNVREDNEEKLERFLLLSQESGFTKRNCLKKFAK